MTIQQPTGTNLLNVPSHSKAHRVWAWDNSAPDKSVVIRSGGEAAFKYGPFIDVTHPDYNADPTGVSDSTTAIQNAINYVASYSYGGGRIFFPAGKYKITSALTIVTPGVKLIGLGSVYSWGLPTSLPTILNYSGGNAIYAYDDGTSGLPFRSFEMRNLTIRNMGDSTGAMIKIVNGVHHVLSNLQIYGLPAEVSYNDQEYNGYGIILDQVQQTIVEKTYINSFGDSNYWALVIRNSSGTEYRCGNISVRDVQIANCYNGIYLDGPYPLNNVLLDEVKVISFSTDTYGGNAGKALVVGEGGRTATNDSVGGVINLVVRDCEFEDKNDGCIELQNCERITIEDNWLHCGTIPGLRIKGNTRGIKYKHNYLTYCSEIASLDSTAGDNLDVYIGPQVLNVTGDAVAKPADTVSVTGGNENQYIWERFRNADQTYRTEFATVSDQSIQLIHKKTGMGWLFWNEADSARGKVFCTPNLTFYDQNDEPSIGSGDIALWKDADGGPKYYLIFNFAGTQKKIELV